LERFKPQGNDCYNFRCPICGDSQKDKKKTRAYIVSSSKKNMTTMYCHNCGASMSLGTFLKTHAPDLYAAYKMDRFGKKLGVKVESLDDAFAETAVEMKTEFGDLLRGCHKLSKCPETLMDVKRYAEKRCIPESLFNELYAVKNVRELASKINKYKDTKFPEVPALVIPFYDEEGDYSYIQCRVIDEDVPQRHRFITLELNDDTKLYGRNRINWSDPVYVLEGPIDAMFIDNALATAGAAAGLYEVERMNREHGNALSNICLLFDNDYTSNPEILDYVLKYANTGYSVVLFDKNFEGIKDVNDAVQNHGWTREEVNAYVRAVTYNGLRAKLELSSLQKRRSNEKKNNNSKQTSRAHPRSSN
jgi:transcription elongation factor Elf1